MAGTGRPVEGRRRGEREREGEGRGRRERREGEKRGREKKGRGESEGREGWGSRFYLHFICCSGGMGGLVLAIFHKLETTEKARKLRECCPLLQRKEDEVRENPSTESYIVVIVPAVSSHCVLAYYCEYSCTVWRRWKSLCVSVVTLLPFPSPPTHNTITGKATSNFC